MKALRTGALEVFVPGSLSPVSRVLGMLGPRSADALKRGTGFAQMVAARDREAEQRYRDRVTAEKDAER